MAAAAVAAADAQLDRNAALNPLDAAEVRNAAAEILKRETVRYVTSSLQHTCATHWVLYSMRRAA
jgi:hypothetical protein